MSNNNGTKPKLELAYNVPTKIKLLQSEYQTGKSSVGQWFRYTVEVEGIEYSFFAPEVVVDFITANKLKKFSEILVTKKISVNGKKSTTDYQVEIVANGNAGHNDSANTDANVSEEYKMMLQSMREAQLIKTQLGDAIDENKIGVALFIQKCRS